MVAVPDYADTPLAILEPLRAACLALPDAHEHHATIAPSWRIRNRTFADLRTVDGPDGPASIVMFRSPDPEREFLLASGHPFFWPGWGTNVLAMVLDDDTDWAEVAELMTESYCLLAPKKLVALVERPAGQS